MAAREDYSQKSIPFEYVDVKKDPGGLKAMLQANGGARQVPTIVEDGKVVIGFGGT